MRTTTIVVHNNEKLEIFVEKRKRHFEFWLAGTIKGRQTLLDHHLTHDDLESHLEYAHPGDLIWRDAAHSEIPVEKHQNAIEMEETVKQATFWDYNDPELDERESLARRPLGLPTLSGPSRRSVVNHLSSIAFLVTDKNEMSVIHRLVLGRWTDGVVTLTMEPNHKLGWSCTVQRHPLNVGEQVHNYAPDWWNFAMWWLALFNNAHKCGTRIGVLRVDERELHFCSSHPHRIAHILQRIVGQAEIESVNQ